MAWRCGFTGRWGDTRSALAAGLWTLAGLPLVGSALAPAVQAAPPVFTAETGATIAEISGDPGSPVPLAGAAVALGGGRAGVAISAGPLRWGQRVKNFYVTPGSAWNVDGSLVMIYMINDASRTSGSQIILDANSLTPLYQPNYPVPVFPNGEKAQVRWSQDPAKPTRQYIVQGHGNRVFEYDVKEGKTIREVMRLPFPEARIGGKGTIAFIDGKEYAAMLGVNGPTGIADAWYFMVDLTDGKTVGQPFQITAPDCGNIDPTACKQYYFDGLYFSPDAKYALVYYVDRRPGHPGLAWRLLDVDIKAPDRVFSSHPLPPAPSICSEPAFEKKCAHGGPEKGFLPVVLGHPAFLYDRAGQVHLVGVNSSWRYAVVPSVTPVSVNGDNAKGVLGNVLDFDPRTNRWRSLTDPCGIPNRPTEAPADYVVGSAGTKGKVFVTYKNATMASGEPYLHAGQIVEYDIGRPGWSKVILDHRADMAACGVDCEVQPNIAPDGSKMLFSSTWGRGNGVNAVIHAFVVTNLAAIASY